MDRGRGADAVDAVHDLRLKVLRRTLRRDDRRVHVRRQERRLEAAGHGVDDDAPRDEERRQLEVAARQRVDRRRVTQQEHGRDDDRRQ